jgi:glycosyltransferase involved in cell wall biosynthesis
LARVLFIAYHFPPIGYSGTQRTVKFVRYLPEHGFEPVVVTGPVETEPGGIPRDETLSDELPRDLRVLRVQGPEPKARTGWRGRTERWFGLEHPWARWWVESVAAAGEVEARVSDLIFATMSPFESSQAAARLSRQTGRPWVADLRDPWALDEMFAYLTVIHRRRARTEMRRSLGSAAAIVMNTPEAAAQLVRAFPELADRPVVAIPNGYDAADFTAPVGPRLDQVFRIAHTGSFHTEAGRARLRMTMRRLLGGTINSIDVLPRSHLYLLQAARLVLERRPELAERLEVHLAGTLSASDRDVIDPDLVRVHGYLAHAESVALIRSADLLFMPMHGLRAGARARIVPGKTYEYLATGHPILAAVPEGDARDLLAAAGTGILCQPDDTEAMADAIIDLIDRRDAGDLPRQPDRAVIERYERRRLTAELAAVFERVLSER